MLWAIGRDVHAIFAGELHPSFGTYSMFLLLSLHLVYVPEMAQRGLPYLPNLSSFTSSITTHVMHMQDSQPVLWRLGHAWGMVHLHATAVDVATATASRRERHLHLTPSF